MDIIEKALGSQLGEMVATLCVSMLPILELRGGIPFGVSIGLSPWMAMIASIIGNMLPVPFIIAFIRLIFAWLRKKSGWLERMVTKLENRAEGKWEIVQKYELIGLMIFVAIPLPGTGAWTGALIAAMLDMRMKHALPAIFLGVLIAGFLITGLTFGFTVIFS